MMMPIEKKPQGGIFGRVTAAVRNFFTRPTVKVGKYELAYVPSPITQRDLRAWKFAIDQARAGRRKQLIQIYQEQLLIDSHLLAVLRKRTSALLQNEIYYFVGNQTVEVAILQMYEFRELLKLLQESLYWGHSLIAMTSPYALLPRVIPHLNVDPVKRVILTENGEEPYDPAIDNRELIEIGNSQDMGLLATATYYSIIKRNVLGDWANYAEEAGRNFRLLKYRGGDVESRNKLIQLLEQHGSSGIYSVPEGIDLEIITQSSNQQNQLFENLVDWINDEITKLVLGQTMTTESGASYAQAAVHERAENMIFVSDKLRIESLLNSVVKPYLYAYGLPRDGFFRFGEVRDIDKMLERDLKLKTLGVIFSDEYLRKRYDLY